MDKSPETPPETNVDYTAITILGIILLLTLVVFIFFHRRKSSKRGVLLTGLCDSGKTVLFSHLVHAKFVLTHTSMKENSGDFVVKDDTLKVIDIPGYERLRGKFFDQYKSTARGIIFVIDSVTLQKDIRDVAEYLYNILIDPIVVSSISAILIVCNKQDLSLAKSISVIKNLLENELNALRLTKSSQLESVDPKGSKKLFLGKEGKDFTFSSLQKVKVEFVESSGSADNTNITAIEEWLSGLCS